MLDAQHLLLVRHGETVGNLEQIAHGQTESPLNPRGIRQVEETASMLSNWERRYAMVYASPLSRAQHTAQIIADALGLPLHTHDDLKEGSLGEWEEVTYDELEQLGFARKSIRDDDFVGHGGESPNQLGQRVMTAVEQITQAHPGENIIIVSHGEGLNFGKIHTRVSPGDDHVLWFRVITATDGAHRKAEGKSGREFRGHASD